jgi:hypothetical protein
VWRTDDKPGLQVLHLRAASFDVSGCNTVSYEFIYIVRNEEVGGSSPLSSTRFHRTYIIFGNRVLLVLPANERAAKSE